MQKKIHRKPLQIQKIDVYPLFIWSDENEILESLLYALKGGGLPAAFERLSKEFILHYEPQLSQELAFFPVPPSVPQLKDHAHDLGKSMAQILGASLHTNLEWVEKHKSQKFLNKKERGELDMRLSKLLKFHQKTKMIIVDDVVTTGATIRAANHAIQGPNPREVWCIACRI